MHIIAEGFLPEKVHRITRQEAQRGAIGGQIFIFDTEEKPGTGS